MRTITGIVVGAVVGIVVAYVFAVAAGSSGPLLFLFVPLGIIIGWRVGASWGTVKRCPACARDAPRAALVCSHCGHAFDDVVPA